MNNQNTELQQEIADLQKQIVTYQQGMLELQQRSDIQDTLNEMLNISLMQIPLNEQMERILLIILNIPWLSLEKKGCVFLTDEAGTGLKMVAYHNLNEPLLSMCNHIRFGQCLCGKAANSQELIFRDCIDQDHDIRPEGMQPHGHYNMPIVSDGNTLGVLNLYVKHGHKQTELEQNLLSASAKAMAGIIERKKIEEKLHKLSYIDSLTGIPNRRHFMNQLDEVIIESRKARLFAILFIDLDRFKIVNDTFGHEFGDKILIEVAQRAQNNLRDTDIIARLGGDEFAVILEIIPSEEKAVEIAEQLIRSISMPYTINEKEISIGASIGISIYPAHSSHGESLLKKADEALYQAKEVRGKAILYSA